MKTITLTEIMKQWNLHYLCISQQPLELEDEPLGSSVMEPNRYQDRRWRRPLFIYLLGKELFSMVFIQKRWKNHSVKTLDNFEPQGPSWIAQSIYAIVIAFIWCIFPQFCLISIIEPILVCISALLISHMFTKLRVTFKHHNWNYFTHWLRILWYRMKHLYEEERGSAKVA